VGIRDAQIALKIAASIDPATVRSAWEELVQINKRAADQQRDIQRELASDWSKSVDESAKNVARYVMESTSQQLLDFQRARDAIKAYGAEMLNLEKAVAGGVDAATGFTKKQQAVWEQGLQIRIANQKRELEIKAAIEKEAADKAERSAAATSSAVGFAGSLLKRTSDGGPGEAVMGAVGGTLQSAISGDILGTLKGILTVAVEFYNEDKRRTQQQVQAAGGTQQFARYAQNAGMLEQAKLNQVRLEHHTGLTVEEQKATPGVMMATAQRGQGAIDIASKDFEKYALDLARTSMTLGQDMTKFAGTVAEIARRTGESGEAVVKAFAEAGGAIDEYNKDPNNKGDRLDKIKFVETVEEMTMALKDQRYTVKDVTAVTLGWIKELDKGTISIQEIVGALKGMHAADPGTQAYLLETALPKMVATLKADMTNGLTGADAAKQGAAADKIIAALTTGSVTERLGAFQNFSSGLQGSSYFKKKGVDTSEEGMRRTQRNAQRAVAAALREKVQASNPSNNEYMQKQLENVLAPGYLGTSLQGKTYNQREALLRGAPSEEAIRTGTAEIEGAGGKKTIIDRATVDQAILDSAAYLSTVRDDTKSIWNKIKDRTIGKAMAVASQNDVDAAKMKTMTAAQQHLYSQRQAALAGEHGAAAQADANSTNKIRDYMKEFGKAPDDLDLSNPKNLANLVGAHTYGKEQKEYEAKANSEKRAEINLSVGLSAIAEKLFDIKPMIYEDRDKLVNGMIKTGGGVEGAGTVLR
jgi:hypothetical protein